MSTLPTRQRRALLTQKAGEPRRLLWQQRFLDDTGPAQVGAQAVRLLDQQPARLLELLHVVAQSLVAPLQLRIQAVALAD